MVKMNPSEIATALTVASIKAGNVGRTPEEVSKYYVEVFKRIREVASEPQKPGEYVFTWQNSQSTSEE